MFSYINMHKAYMLLVYFRVYFLKIQIILVWFRLFFNHISYYKSLYSILLFGVSVAIGRDQWCPLVATGRQW